MREQKEILIQDLKIVDEVERFKEYHVYRRDLVFGSPLYFAPYFTRESKQPEGEGISYLSKVLGIISLEPNQINSYKDDLLAFSNHNEALVEKWIIGVKKIKPKKKDDVVSCFFLDKPLKLYKPLLKDGGNKKGRGKGWIAAMIPKNRCVTFAEFVKRIIK